MSEVLEELVEPYAYEVGSEEAYENLISLGAMAWNMTVMPPEASKEAMKGIIAMLGDDPEDVQFVTEQVHNLMQRKKKLFPNEDRLILDFFIEDLGDQRHLKVISHLAPKKGDAA
ncbi:hypothetical protein [Candidatus Leptofilum sp.]|uniref:hypothetical protein n=1 Tax=Candidatus Leptofilum sp. TaxID=3241576 RepID=UPI003B5A56B0